MFEQVVQCAFVRVRVRRLRALHAAQYVETVREIFGYVFGLNNGPILTRVPLVMSNSGKGPPDETP